MVTSQYPHTIKIFSIAEDSKLDGNGNYVTDDPEECEKEGRYEPSKGNAFINGPDGTQINYAGIVYMPLLTAPIELGSKVEVYDRGVKIAEGRVLQFFWGRFNSKVWLG